MKLTELAAYGMHAKAPKIAQLKGTRRVATLLATMRHLEGVSVDDALLLFDLLMATRLLARAGRDEKNEKLKSLPRLRKAALQAESALWAALDTPMTQPGRAAAGEAGNPGAGPVGRVTTAQEMIARIALVVPIEQLEAALAVIREFLPAEQDDADLAWRAELTSRFASVRGFVELLAETVLWGGTDAGTPVIAALRALPRVLAYGKHAGTRHIEAHKGPGVGLVAAAGVRRPRPGRRADRPACPTRSACWRPCGRRCAARMCTPSARAGPATRGPGSSRTPCGACTRAAS